MVQAEKNLAPAQIDIGNFFHSNSLFFTFHIIESIQMFDVSNTP